MKLFAVGFCGADDSVHPHQLVMHAHHYPFVEFGVLFRPDKEGQPRYASEEWVALLSESVRNYNHSNPSARMKLAAHLCERRVDEVLRGDDSFVKKLQDWGFGRIQINATAVNGVDTSVLDTDPSGTVDKFLSVVRSCPGVEFILQQNAETRPLWEGVLKQCSGGASSSSSFPPNVSMLLDESKGTGVLPAEWPPIPPGTPYRVGYAGGIGPDNVGDVLGKIRAANDDDDDDDETDDDTAVWIDMESSLRSQKNGSDVFDLDKCCRVMREVCDQGYFDHPPMLTTSPPTNGT